MEKITSKDSLGIQKEIELAYNFEIFDEIQRDTIVSEEVCMDIRALNKNFNENDDLILYLNIRSINANFASLEIFVESLISKPFYICCSEAWVIDNPNFFQLNGYNMYYNESDLNKADGVVVYIKDCIIEETEIVQIDKLRIANSTIKMSNGSNVEISALYRSHSLNKTDFINSLNTYLRDKKNCKNHFVIGDFNIDLIKLDVLGQEFLNNFLEHGFLPSFHKITRPSINDKSDGTCIDNIFYKLEKAVIKSFILQNSITDHYTLIVKLKKLIPQEIKQDTFIYTHYNKLLLNTILINWNQIYCLTDPNEATDWC